MRRVLAIPLMLLCLSQLKGQLPVGSWSDHLGYNTANRIAVGSREVFASTGSSLIVYNKEFAELKKLSPVNGLSETGISAIAWSEEYGTLVIAYKSTNIDLIIKNTVYNIPDILNKNIPGNKEVNRIRISGKHAYLATSFGVVVVDLVKHEIYDTWRPGPDADYNEVFDLAFGNNKVYTATNLGVWSADLSSQGLTYFGNWNHLFSLPDPDARCTLTIFSGNNLYVNISLPSSTGDSVFAIDGGTTLFSYSPGIINRSFDPAPDGFTISSPGFLRYYRSDGSLQKTISSYGWGTTDISQGIIENNNIWLADISNGLIKGNNMTEFVRLSLPGPSSNDIISITSLGGKTIICGGGTDNDWNRLGRAFQVSAFENNQFTNFVSGTYSDAMRSCIDPENSSHFFVSTWGNGLFEYRNNELVKHYNETNSPLQSGNSSVSDVKVCGLVFDKYKNLWVTQTGVTGNIKILKPDGGWIVYPVTIEAPVIGDIISTGTGQKWIILPGGYGLFVLDDNKTPDLFTDDSYKKITIRDSDEKIISSVFSIAEDLDGNIWAGTDQGPVIYYNPEKILKEELRAYRIKVPRNDGTGLADYMLGTETISSISVDGANRKWLGTSGSGAYHLSPDGTTMLKNYNKLNSPLFSDTIASVSVDNNSGEVWFGTSNGVLSVREVATTGSTEYNKVYSFPNPVRETFGGNVTITGLIRDTQIHITDVSGNLVFETVSDGGQASWDLTTYSGRRVTTGVYLVFCASSDGSQSFVTKILIIH